MVTIPWFDLAFFTEDVTLDDTPYVMTMRWNSRGAFWTTGFADFDQNDILTGRKLVLGGEILRQHTGVGLPPGMMFAKDETGNAAPIAQGDFLSGRVKLVYVTEAEVTAA